MWEGVAKLEANAAADRKNAGMWLGARDLLLGDINRMMGGARL